MSFGESRRHPSKSWCELYAGPMDGQEFEIPDGQDVLRFSNLENPATFTIYERDGDQARFLHRGWEKESQP